MKTIKFIFVSLLAAAVLSACAKHDFFDDMLITGEVGPQAYWEIGSAMINAGSDMDFDLQYYSTVADIDRSEVWYNITETLDKTVSCPWIISRTYSIASVKDEEKRISQKIREYPHSLAVWSDSLHAYRLKATFKVSNTLSAFTWKPEVFEYDKMEAYFGTGFMEHFKDSLSTLLTYADYKNMLVGMGLVDDFMQYTDSTFDENSDSYQYHFPKDASGNTPVPAEINEIFADIPFDQLVEKASVYYVEYKRDYSINAIMRVYDTRGVYGTTVSKPIKVN